MNRKFSMNQITPINYSLCGQLNSKDEFVHIKRAFDENVLIFVNKGVLFINSNNKNYSLKENQYILLKAGESHFGWKKSEGYLSYLWVHFRTESEIRTVKDDDLQNSTLDSVYFFPESGELENYTRFSLLFRQMMDISFDEGMYKKKMLDYSLSLLLLELSKDKNTNTPYTKISPLISDVCSWIKANYDSDFTLEELADTFGYQAEYLSSLFRKEIELTIKQYLINIRINIAKNLLSNYGLSIKEVSYSCGFMDEKYFMKVFKKKEGLTPTEYKSAFFKKNIN